MLKKKSSLDDYFAKPGVHWEGRLERTAARGRAQAILSASRDLPTIPSALAQLSRVFDDPYAGAEQIERLVRPDPVLTANLLRLANSPYFGVRAEIRSVRQAIAVFGVRRVFDLAASAWLGHALPERLPGYDIGAKSFWLHCLAVGAIAEQLAKVAGIETSERLYAAGLFHDIGKLATGYLLDGEALEMWRIMDARGATWVEAEGELLGTDHGEVGCALAQAWQLPEEIASAAGWHHQPLGLPPSADHALVDLIHLADGLAHSLGFGADAGELSRRVDDGVYARLMIGSEEIELAASESLVCQIWDMGDVVAGGVDV